MGEGLDFILFGEVVGSKSPKLNNFEGGRKRGRSGLGVILFREVVDPNSQK